MARVTIQIEDTDGKVLGRARFHDLQDLPEYECTQAELRAAQIMCQFFGEDFTGIRDDKEWVALLENAPDKPDDLSTEIFAEEADDEC